MNAGQDRIHARLRQDKRLDVVFVPHTHTEQIGGHYFVGGMCERARIQMNINDISKINHKPLY